MVSFINRKVIKRHIFALLVISLWIFSLLCIKAANAYELPPYEGLSLKIEGNVSENYSNNITYAAEDDQRIEALITNLSLGMGLKYEETKRSVELRGNLIRQIRTETGDIENSYERGIINFRNEFSKYDLINIFNTFTHTQVPGTLDEGLSAAECQRLEDLFGRDVVRRTYPECDRFEEEFGRLTGRFDSYKNTAILNYYRDFGERFRTSTGYTYRRNWSNEKGTNDSDQNSFRVGVNYGYSAATIFSLYYTYSNSRYENGSDVAIQRISAGIRRYLTERFFIDGRAGMDFTSSENNSQSNSLIEISIAGEADKKTIMRAAYLKQDEFASDTEDIFRNWRATGSITRDLTEDLSIDLSGFYGKGEFVSIAVTDTLLGASINVNYIFWEDKYGKRVIGRLGYTYSDLQSTDDTREYSRSGVNMGLTVGF